MGCFSYICKECGKPILSDSFSGQKVKLFLLENGRIKQKMEGQYNSYGRVFTENLENSVEWEGDWGDIITDHFGSNSSEGIAAIHTECYKQDPTTKSEDDPNQGWGDEQ